jgi:hypothetical protein
MLGLKTNEEKVKECTEALNKKLAAYEVILSRQQYLAGNVRSILTFNQCFNPTFPF